MRHLILLVHGNNSMAHNLIFLETILKLIFYHCNETSDIQVKKGTVKYTESWNTYSISHLLFLFLNQLSFFFLLDGIFEIFLSFLYCDQPPCPQDFP